VTRGGRQPGAGRKPDGGIKRTHRVGLVFTEDEHELVRAAADGESLAKWIRTLTLAAARDAE
jgi:hypothetical protein